jgi:hypothetical protein
MTENSLRPGIEPQPSDTSSGNQHHGLRSVSVYTDIANSGVSFRHRFEMFNHLFW